MPNVIGVRLHGRGKTWHYAPGDLKLKRGDAVIVESPQGVELGFCVNGIIDLPADKINEAPTEIMRSATAADLAQYEQNLQSEKEAFHICAEKIAKHELPMNLVDAEYLFDRKKVIFYFTAEGRVDFRDLVKDLTTQFHTRIELRQIGVRDEARLCGGLGICGRELCCCSFLRDFQPVSIKMAKEQSLSMNPNKISGACGRLLCCLKYEQDAYEDAHRRLPVRGERISTAFGEATVESVNLLKETVLLRLCKDDTADAITLPVSEIQRKRDREHNQQPKSGGCACPKRAAAAGREGAATPSNTPASVPEAVAETNPEAACELPPSTD